MAKASRLEPGIAPGAEPIDAEKMYSASRRVPCEGSMIREVGHMLRRTVNGGQEKQRICFPEYNRALSIAMRHRPAGIKTNGHWSQQVKAGWRDRI